MHLSHMKRASALATAALLFAALGACSDSTDASESTYGPGTWAKAEGTIVFGAVPDKAGSDSNNKPLEDYIAKQTGLKVEYYPTADYTALIAAAVAGKVDVMVSGGLQYVMAVNKGAKLEPVAAALSSPEVNDPGYYSEAVVPPGSSITSLSEAKGMKVCFVDPNSTSGYLFGLYQLKNAGLNVEASGSDANGNPTFDDFTPVFAGAHDKSVQSVATSQCDVGFAEDTETQPAATKGDVTVVAREYVPGGPLSISSVLPDDVKAQLTQVLQGATVEAITASGVSITDGFSSTYFGAQAKDESYYQTIIDLCTSIPAAKCAA